MITEKDICCIIPYREADGYRKNNLFCVIDMLNNYFPEMKILVIEQDKEPTLESNNKFISEFIFNDKLFNKSWALNIGINLCDKKYCMLYDSDLLMRKEDLKQAFVLIDKYEVVKPFLYLYYLGENQSKKLYKDKEYKFENLEIESKTNRAGPISGGIIIFNKIALEKIGGWLENFEGFGGEDDGLDVKIRRFLSYKVLPLSCFHLYHSRCEANDYINHSNYQNNIDLFYKIHAMNNQELISMIEIQKKTNGNINKYRN